MKVLRFLIALSFTCCAVSIAAQTTSPSLDGVVVDLGSNAPLQNATLELRGVSDSTRRYIAVSSGTGQFVFRGVAAGNYSLSVVRAGYLQIQYGQRGPNGSPATLMISASQRVSGLRLAMIRASAISGHVYDQDGAPAVNAQLHAWKISYNTGLRLAIPVTSQMTNDRGEYRLFGMPPGVYYISAQPEPPMHIRSPAYASRAPLIPGSILSIQTGGMFSALPDPAFARPGGRQEWAPVYFGGTTDEYAATPIYLRAGTDLGGIDIIVNRLPVGRLTGTVIGPDGQPLPQASVIVTPQRNPKFHAMPIINVSGGVMSISPAPPARSNQTGQFGIGSLAPAAYSLTAVLASPNGPRLSGYTSVAVQGTDVANATITMGPMFEIDGRIAVEGAATGDVSALSVRAISTVNAMADTPKVSPSAAGTFKLGNVGRGSYVLDVTPLTPDSFVKSARLGDVDVLNDGFRLDNPPDRPLEIVIGLKGGTIRGIVRDSSRAAAGGITVALVPDEIRRQRYELFRSATTDNAGRYEFRGIPPGTYKVFAWEDIDPKSWMEPAYLRVFEDLGKVVAVGEGSSEIVDVSAISPLER
jgi:Carboxypeptidase regulatory-like domain